MSVTTATGTSSALRGADSTSWVNGLVGSRTGRRLLAGAAVLYLGAWLLALSVAPSGATVTATGSQVLASLQGHLAASAVQYLAAEVVAGLALVVVMLGVAGASVGYSRPASRVVAACAVVAGAVSVLQGALGLWLTTVVAPAGDTDLAARVFQLITRADGLKMVDLAVLATAAVMLGRRGAFPRWLTGLAGVLAFTVAVSGAGYLFLVDSLAAAAYLSLPVLLVWVAGCGLSALGRARKA